MLASSEFVLAKLEFVAINSDERLVTRALSCALSLYHKAPTAIATIIRTALVTIHVVLSVVWSFLNGRLHCRNLPGSRAHDGDRVGRGSSTKSVNHGIARMPCGV